VPGEICRVEGYLACIDGVVQASANIVKKRSRARCEYRTISAIRYLLATEREICDPHYKEIS
jgi:hypothetical protein